ncbi:MAG: cation:proton antiporter [Gammaproteobacteria bacterium]|nr:cation:proton antiporter [Gammaproteobacteria bacterium]
MPLEALIAGSVFVEIAALLVLAALVGFIGMMLRQPLIVAFIAVGLLVGPDVLDLIHSKEEIELLSELGIAVLLFLVGIKLDIKLVRSLGVVSLFTGLGQVLFTSVFGFLIGLALGFSAQESVYIAVALTFSSTIIIVKLLSDKREIDALHGQVALGFLIVQDLVVVFAMVVLSAIGIGAGSEEAATTEILRLFLYSGLLLVAVGCFVKWVAVPLTDRLAHSPELLITFAIALAALFAALGDLVGFGKELGGLLAGVALASTRYREAIAARLAPLRDFLLLFFFISLGISLNLGNLGDQLGGALVFSLFVLVGNPLIVMVIMGIMGYRKRTGFLAGLTVAQISEFSLIFIAMGVTIGHVGNDVLSLVTLVGLVTIAASTYMITWSHELFAFFERWLGVFERSQTPREQSGPVLKERIDVLVFGTGRFGSALGFRLHRAGLKVLGVDFNPAAVERWRQWGLDCEYGDATDPEFLASLPLTRISWAVSTVPSLAPGVTHDDHRLTLIQSLRAAGYDGRIAVTSHMPADSDQLREAGANLVIQPFQDAADRVVELLTSGEKPERLDEVAVDVGGQREVAG